jgi:hypothetical protein
LCPQGELLLLLLLLLLRPVMCNLHVLNCCCCCCCLLCHPRVLQVLHGGANDIAWLQRDAHVYLVNVFDTEKAAHVSVLGPTRGVGLMYAICSTHSALFSTAVRGAGPASVHASHLTACAVASPLCLLIQVLGREERSLAHLLRRYCGVTQDKTHQTADWRLHPLAPQLQAYARSDVHWLPYLAGLMVGELQTRSPSTTGVSVTGCFSF